MKELEKIYKALGNGRRLQIIKMLKNHRDLSVGDIARAIKLSIRSTSRHLAVLRAANVVEKDQRGLLVFYSLTPIHKAVKHALILV